MFGKCKKRIKTLLFTFILLIIIYIVVEGLSFASYFLLSGHMFSYAEFHVKQISIYKETVVEFDAKTSKSSEVIHPYLGYVCNPEINNPYFEKKHGFPISEYGFIDNNTPFHAPAKDKVIVGFFGGSVAYWYSAKAISALTNELHKYSYFKDKTIVPVRTAIGGYKQPQQLMTLSYLLSLGAHFDVVINLDGFNEIALPPSENIPKNVFPFYPRNWYFRMMQAPNITMQTLIGKITYLREKRKNTANVFSSSFLRYSITLNLLWNIYDRYLILAINEAMVSLQKQSYKTKDTDYIVSGPSVTYTNDTAMYKDLVDVWKRSSFQMSKLCAANGIRYFHFLQPSQYVKGSKKMGYTERKIAILDNHPFKICAEKGYPFLIEAGQKLKNDGVEFHDLTMVFSNVENQVYIDNACHLNQTGNNILGSLTGKVIGKEYADE